MREIPYNYDKFKDYSVGDMFKYIIETEDKYSYLYDIFSYKFDEKYNTVAKRTEVFEKLSLSSLSRFANTYKSIDNKLDATLEEIWTNKSLEQYKEVIQATEEVLFANSSTRCWSVCNLDLLNMFEGRLTGKQFEMHAKMIQIFQTLLVTNLMYIEFDSFEKCNIVVDFMDYINRETKGAHIPKLLRLSDDEVIRLIKSFDILYVKLMKSF